MIAYYGDNLVRVVNDGGRTVDQMPLSRPHASPEADGDWRLRLMGFCRLSEWRRDRPGRLRADIAPTA